MFGFEATGNLTREQLEVISQIQKRENRSTNFRWLIAGFVILGLGICWIDSKYGKSQIQQHKEEKKPDEQQTPE